MSIVDNVIKDMGIHIITKDDHDPRYGMNPGDRCLYMHENRVIICEQIFGGIFYGFEEENNKHFMCNPKGLKKIE